MKNVYIFVIAVTLLAFLVRFTAVSTVPPGLYIDEVSNGLNAYMILTTGRDEHGVPYPLWFKAFGEYKLPVMIYLIAGSMAFFGKTELAVRLPSVLAGTLSVPLFFMLLYQLVLSVKDRKLQFLPYVSAVLLAVTPWHIHFSRGGFEATIALFFTLLGIASFLKYLQKSTPSWLLIGTVAFAITMYTYNAYRIITVLLALFIFGYLIMRKKASKKVIFLNILFFVLLILPVIIFSISPEGSERFTQTSLLSSYAKQSYPEKAVMIPMDFLNNYLRYFSPEYLFAIGDQNGRHQVPGSGLLYRWESIFLVVGLFTFFKRKKDLLFSVSIFLLFIAPLAAALTIPSPHALRSLLMVVPFTTIVALGIISVLSYFQKYKKSLLITSLLLGGAIFFEFLYLNHLYFQHYPKVNLLDWGGGYKETIQKAGEYRDYEIVIDSNMGNITPFIKFYDDSLRFKIVSTDWQKPHEPESKEVLLIRPDYKEAQKKNRIDAVYLPNTNKDIFAEFYSL